MKPVTMRHDQSQKDSSAIELLSEKAREADDFEVYKRPHANRIAWLADHLAQAFALGTEDRISLKQASLSHDFGELAMRREYIAREGSLTNEEQLDMHRHPLFGEQEAARAGADRGAQLIVRWHHEWWNGLGYPDALSREQIPLTARILRLADSVVSMTDSRPYRHAMTIEQIRRHVRQWAGLEFDPRVVNAFLNLNTEPTLVSYAEPEAGISDSPESDLSVNPDAQKQ